MATLTPTRVVVADDSALMRRIVSSALTSAGVKVVGNACDGDEALALCERERPDLLCLDLAMPGLDGLGVLRELRRPGRPKLPVVVVSAFSPASGARAVDALAEGAFDLVAKPMIGETLESFQQNLIDKVMLAVTSPPHRPEWVVGRLTPHSGGQKREVGRLTSHNGGAARARTRTKVSRAVVIATSTGGPKALAELMPGLPCPLGSGTLIVQHMPPGFTKSLAARLDAASPLAVREAEGGEILDPRAALIAPGGRHLRITEEGRTKLTDEAEIGALRPRADLTIEDAARVFGENLLLVVMTGMGNDGLLGAQAVKRHGGRVIAEAQESCTVYGMPRAVHEAKLTDDVFPLSELAAAIVSEASL